jgi:hypothetical protein
VPGCRSARNLDLHHIDHQRDGGGHALSNLSVVCSGHHQQLHEGALKISGQAPHALVFTWRDAPQAECAPSGAVDQGARTDQTAAGGSPPEAYSGAAENVSQGEDEALVRGDLPVCSIPEGQAHEARIGDGADTLARDAQIALVTAGYEPSEARAAVERARSHVGEPMSLEHLIREALRCLATAATG